MTTHKPAGRIVTADEIATTTGLAKQHFLNSSAERINKSLGDLAGLTTLGFHLIEVAPGKMTTEHHVHHHEDECVFVLSGSGTAFLGDTATHISAGDFVGYLAGGQAHHIENTGTTPLQMIVAGARLPHDVVDYPRANRRLFRNDGMEWCTAQLDELEFPKAGAKS